jgi:hypothetical protein
MSERLCADGGNLMQVGTKKLDPRNVIEQIQLLVRGMGAIIAYH